MIKENSLCQKNVWTKLFWRRWWPIASPSSSTATNWISVKSENASKHFKYKCEQRLPCRVWSVDAGADYKACTIISFTLESASVVKILLFYNFFRVDFCWTLLIDGYLWWSTFERPTLYLQFSFSPLRDYNLNCCCRFSSFSLKSTRTFTPLTSVCALSHFYVP